jgi:hypothetical protein
VLDTHEKADMNLILKFPDPSKRDEFLRQLTEERDDIVQLYRGSRNVPNAVVTSLSPEQATWVRQHVNVLGRAYEDLQFETFSG